MEAEASRARRADAVANEGRILEAAVACLSRDPGASVSRIAKEAGVGRVTLYGHFPSRESLVEAAMSQVLSEGDAVLGSLELDGDPGVALRSLIESSWRLVARSRALLEAAEATLPPGRVQELHARPAMRVDELVRRGQFEGAFRADLPADWMVSVLHHLMHGAAADVRSGRIQEADAARLIADTVLPAFGAA